MRRFSVLLAATVAAGFLAVSAPASANHPNPHPTSCGTPTAYHGADAGGAHVFVCTPAGYGGASMGANGQGYVLADGAPNNPEQSKGYVVIVINGADSYVACSESGHWNPGNTNRVCP